MPLLNVGAGKTEKVATRYEAQKLIDAGSFAEVYRAYDLRDGVQVALKVYVKPITPKDSGERAKREIAVLRKLAGSDFFPDRAASVGPLHLHDKQRHHLLVMELGEYQCQEDASQDEAGRRPRFFRDILSLEEATPRMGSAAPPPKHRPEFWEAARLAGWVTDLCEAVRLMHGRGVLHLDLKPANILLKRVAGRDRSVPFLIDFNTAVEPGAAKFEGATLDYRAPEATRGTRTAPGVADDLYALALVLTEIHFGLGSHKRARDGALKPHALVAYPVESLRKALLRALEEEPGKRFTSAAEFKLAVTAALAVGPAGAAGLTPEEMAYIRANAPRIRENIEETLTGRSSLYVSKALREEVASLLSNLSAETTDSLDLKARLLELGQKAAPAVFAEGYKLDVASPHFPVVVEALADFGRREDERIKAGRESHVDHRVRRSLDDYRLSGSYVVRKMCREVCKDLGIFPPGQREVLRNGSEILLPDERAEVAELCLTCGTAETDLRALLLYVCDEFCADPRSETYWGLRRRAADRVGGMKVANKAGLMAAWAYERLWEKSEGYEEAAAAERPELARQTLQLFGDAFASLGDEALRALRSGVVKERLHGDAPPRYLWQSFAVKLARAFPTAREWLLGADRPPDGITPTTWEQARDKVSGTDTTMPPPPPNGLFKEYMASGDKRLLKQLVWSPRLGDVLTLAEAAAVKPDAAARVLTLLRGCEGKSRSRVLSIAFTHYLAFAETSYRDLVQVVCQAGLPDKWSREQAVKQLEADLNIPERRELATEWLNRLLEDE